MAEEIMRTKKTTFAFKQFELDQADCAMKINTDGVLIGAFASHGQPQYILDVGTGTGIIALMLAQRFPDALVDAVEIDEAAAIRARSNAEHTSFAPRVKVYHKSFEAYDSTVQYDLIVSNPPFFINDLKNTELRKGIARHTDLDFFRSFVKQSAKLLSEKGRLYIILPPKVSEEFVVLASAAGLFPNHKIYIHSDETKESFREITCLSKEKTVVNTEHFYIYAGHQEHTIAYKALLKDFFLAF